MSRLCVQATWDDVPHLDADTKAELLAGMPPHMRDARTKGVPMLGSGAIYPLPESAVFCDPFEIPKFWPKAYGLDVGWKITAACWGAWDRTSDTVYIWSEYYAGQAPPVVHASGIQARGNWMRGAIDPASAGASQKDGSRLIDEYGNLGLYLIPADNAVEAGLFTCYQRMARGGLKIFKTCRNLLSEYRIYRRDENGKIVKENDHLMDALRYLIMTGMRFSSTEPELDDDGEDVIARHTRSSVTGY
jgi:hypothetical protein